jgi:hypothetical protein
MWTTIGEVEWPLLLNALFWCGIIASAVAAALIWNWELVPWRWRKLIAYGGVALVTVCAATTGYINKSEREEQNELRNRIKTSVEGNFVFELREVRPLLKDGRTFLNIRTTYGQEFNVLTSPSSGEDERFRRLASLPPGTLLAIPWENASKEFIEELPASVVIERSNEGNLSLRIK